MDITYLGHAAFRLRGKHATVVCDPYDSDMVGIKFPKHIEADIVTISHDHPDHNAAEALEGSPYRINGPGEYEVKGIGVVGKPSYHDNEKGAVRGKNTIYRIEIDGVSIVHLGDIGHTLTNEQVEELGTVHVLFVPVGGQFTIDAKAAAQMIAEIEPNIVIPMHFGRPELDQKAFGQLAPVDMFLKEIGKEAVKTAKLTITKDKVPETMQVVVFE